MQKYRERHKEIYLAGGCFWGLEEYMSRVPGVVGTTVGYANGKTVNPTYHDVCYRDTGHAETGACDTAQIKSACRIYCPCFIGLLIPPCAIVRATIAAHNIGRASTIPTRAMRR